MLKNIMYTGVLRSGETQSGVFPELQIVDVELWERAQEIMEKRTTPHSGVPLNTKGTALLAGLVYCGHCGSKLVLTTNGKRYDRPTGKQTPRVRYCCHYKVRHPQLCDGQSGYGMPKLDALVERAILALFERVKATSKENMLQNQYERQASLGRIALEQATERFHSKAKELQLYKSEVKNVIARKSSFSMELLTELIDECQQQIVTARDDMEIAQFEIDNHDQLTTEVSNRYNKILTWADMFSESTIEAKKMIVAQLIKRIRVGQDYALEIDLHVHYEMFGKMLDGNTADGNENKKESA